jgi:hypothetical protein
MAQYGWRQSGANRDKWCHRSRDEISHVAEICVRSKNVTLITCFLTQVWHGSDLQTLLRRDTIHAGQARSIGEWITAAVIFFEIIFPSLFAAANPSRADPFLEKVYFINYLVWWTRYITLLVPLCLIISGRTVIVNPLGKHWNQGKSADFSCVWHEDV